jgi:transporter family protein
MSLPYLIVLAILGWGIGSLFYKMANDSLHPFMVSAIATIVYLIEVPLVFTFAKFNKTVTPSGIAFAILGSSCMAVGSIGYFFALKKGSAGEITAVSAVYPAITLLLSMFFLGEEMSWRKAIGMLLALASVFILGFK